MNPDERTLLEGIDKILRSEEVRAQIQPVVERVRDELARTPAALMTWEPIPLAIYGNGLPPEIRSSWVFVLRAGADTGAERHPNSHQRMMSFKGTGDMRTEDQRSEGMNQRSAVGGQRSERKPGKAESGGEWQSNVLVSTPEAPLEQRWVSIPPNVWHRPVIGPETDWVVVSFHTVPAEELIEERPAEDGAGARRKRYLGGVE